MTTRELVRHLGTRIGVLQTTLPTSSATRDVADELAKRIAGIAPPPSKNELAALAARLLAAAAQARWDAVSERDWQRAPWVLGYGQPCLADRVDFLAALLQALNEANLARGYRALIYVYLRDFPAGWLCLGEIAAGLRAVMVGSGLVALDHWREAHRAFNLFDPNDGPRHLASALFEIDPELIFSRAGLRDELAQVGFAEKVHAALLDLLHRSLRDGRTSLSQLQRICDFVHNGREFRFPGQKADVADALLLPWSEGREPPDDVRAMLLPFLTGAFGDPRTAPAGWQGVDRLALAVVRRWLARETIEQFFGIIDRFALEQQWRYRKAFWLAYYHKGFLDEAWLALGRTARHQARFVLGAGTECGELIRGAYDPYQSVLMMRIQHLIFVDWSHNGRFRAWEAEGEAPRLYESTYVADDLRRGGIRIPQGDADGGVTHAGSANGRWQRKISDFIEYQTGIRMNERDYMPR